MIAVEEGEYRQIEGKDRGENAVFQDLQTDGNFLLGIKDHKGSDHAYDEYEICEDHEACRYIGARLRLSAVLSVPVEEEEQKDADAYENNDVGDHDIGGRSLQHAVQAAVDDTLYQSDDAGADGGKQKGASFIEGVADRFRGGTRSRSVGRCDAQPVVFGLFLDVVELYRACCLCPYGFRGNRLALP